MSKTMKRIPAVLLAGLMAVAAAFAVGAFTAQEAYADVPISGLYVGNAGEITTTDDSNYALRETTDGEAQLVGVAAMNGDGTKTSPYEITSYEDLKEFASIVNGTHPYAPQNTSR